VYPGRQFTDESGHIRDDASVWAHPSLHQFSSIEDLLAIKRRAPPKLFRTRRLANGEVVCTRAGPEVTARAMAMHEERLQHQAQKRQEALLRAEMDQEKIRLAAKLKRASGDRPTPKVHANGWDLHGYGLSTVAATSRNGELPSQRWPFYSLVTDSGPTSGLNTPSDDSAQHVRVPSPTEILQAIEANKLRQSISSSQFSSEACVTATDAQACPSPATARPAMDQPWKTATQGPKGYGMTQERAHEHTGHSPAYVQTPSQVRLAQSAGPFSTVNRGVTYLDGRFSRNDASLTSRPLFPSDNPSTSADQRWVYRPATPAHGPTYGPFDTDTKSPNRESPL
jgi:hypothetical protein